MKVDDDRVQKEPFFRPEDDVRVQQEQPLRQKMMVEYKKYSHYVSR